MNKRWGLKLSDGEEFNKGASYEGGGRFQETTFPFPSPTKHKTGAVPTIPEQVESVNLPEEGGCSEGHPAKLWPWVEGYSHPAKPHGEGTQGISNPASILSPPPTTHTQLNQGADQTFMPAPPNRKQSGGRWAPLLPQDKGDPGAHVSHLN